MHGSMKTICFRKGISTGIYTGFLTVVCLLLAGCSAPVQNQPYTTSDTTPTAESLDETTEEPISPTPVMENTAVPVAEVTNLPEHAPTITPVDEPVETGIAGELPLETPVTAGTVEIETELDTLIGDNVVFPEGEIKILRPGTLSKLASPFRVEAILVPGPHKRVQVRLVGEDGRTIDSKTVKTRTVYDTYTPNLVTEIEFEIEAVAEAARLEISVNDEFNRTRVMNSVDVIILSSGKSNYNYAGDLREEIIINVPLANYMIQGDTLYVSGLVRTTSEKPLELMLIDETGTLIAVGQATVVIPEGSYYGLFAGEIKYSLEEPIWVRLSVRIPGGRIPGTVYIKTLEVVISP